MEAAFCGLYFFVLQNNAVLYVYEPKLSGAYMTYSEQIIQQVQSTANLVIIVKTYVPITGSHKVLKGTCPFHQDTQSSFMVSPEKNIFKCFGCGRDGGPIEFIMAIKSLSREEAIELLANEMGLFR
jgi:DNA primase